MERSNHRVRQMPTAALLQEAVELLLDAQLNPFSAERHQAKFSRLLRELGRRDDIPTPAHESCQCIDCLGDLHQGHDDHEDPF